ncbi:LysR family transcriptional regulator [Mesobaculum littorinae]|uniref:LysR family transcriptional regulator n=1 Tax=Mesobaculum littorinae TaxID=2486419 RepID=A0A438AGT0_9RHOB|nr:LysR family transcriptional regulator [Mesobaculum littorinae]RVV97916.1 LysR family transcriptional regulator [Mesobaculum littorinae]
MTNSSSLDDLAIFHMVVREGGFRAAARRLGLAPSKVSNTVGRMEASLGVPLLRRTTRSVSTTDAGRTLADRIGPLIAGLDAARAEAAEGADRVRGRLKLNVPGAVMPDVLPPILAAFHAHHPEVEVEIVVENGLVDIVAAGCDAGIRYDDILAQDMVSVPVGPRMQQIALAAAPDYLRAHGTPAAPRDLTEHQAIRYRLSDGPLLPWQLVEDGRTITVEPIPRLILGVNAIDTGLTFARAGIGIIATFRNWLERDFAAGTLIPVLPDRWPARTGPRLYYPSRHAPRPLRAFIEMCRDQDKS